MLAKLITAHLCRWLDGEKRMDNHSKEVRSYNMSRIRSKNTKPEELGRKALFAAGFRYRKNVRKLPGQPDVVLSKYRTVIFVNGCYWHGHEGCKYFVMPKTNVEYWGNKIECNQQRDKENHRKLKELGWHVVVIWECEICHSNKENTLKKLSEKIKGKISTV